MLVQHYYPQSLSPARLDKYLANGWFRSAPMLFRSELICLEGDIFSSVNIRIKLKNYIFKKRFRKILNRNNQQFEVEINKFKVDTAKERLYQQHKRRFKGFIFETLEQFFYAGLEETVFDTYEICVYEGNKLVAASFFDQGQNSIASILGLYDQDYEKFSLGMYTMLLEISYAIGSGMKYYYPGYVLDKPSVFDYKLRLGNMEYYNWHGKWKPLSKITDETFLADQLRVKIEALENILQENHTSYQKFLYPLFSLGYVSFLAEHFVTSTIYLSIHHTTQSNHHIIVEYFVEEEVYRILKVSTCPEYQDFMNMNISKDLLNNQMYSLELLRCDEMIFQHNSPEQIARKLPYILS